MEKDKMPLWRVYINLIIGLIFFIGFTVVFVLTFTKPDIFGKMLTFTKIASLVLMLIFAAINGALIRLVRSKYKFFRSLLDENYYTLGVHSTFFNLEAFRDKVHVLEGKHSLKNKERYLLAFSPTATNIAGGVSRNRILQGLNQTIASFINRIMVTKENSVFSRKNAVYAFDRNSFLFYLFANDEIEVHSLISQLTNECFRLVNEESIKIWVQPFSGICKVNDDERSLTAVIEKALIAKSQSEQNIESFTYFKESFTNKDTNIAEDIIEGLERNEFIPFYQAKYSLKEKKIISCEVLARWKTTEGILAPSKFIERAGRAGLLNRIDMVIFEGAMKDLGDALKRGRRVVPV